MTRAIGRSSRQLPTRETQRLSLRTDPLTVSSPEVPRGVDAESYNEKAINWVGVCIAVVGITLMVLSFMLGDGSS
ncbi:MAG: hypothetical protein JOZ19_13400 [Rubrobacter sp.]|nr:hypothetical protein [Rubrobacter sp.]